MPALVVLAMGACVPIATLLVTRSVGPLAGVYTLAVGAGIVMLASCWAAYVMAGREEGR